MDNKAQQNISDKDWLDLAFKHFVQHAQQRVQHFNYFIIFSSLLTTGTITTLQPNVKAYYLGIGLGLIQLFVSFIFSKLDDRNRFLIKHAENIIKRIEKDYRVANLKCYPLFSSEEMATENEKKVKKNKICFLKPISHKKSYNLIYSVFGIVGFISFITSLALFLSSIKIQSATSQKELTSIQIINTVDFIFKDKFDTALLKIITNEK